MLSLYHLHSVIRIVRFLMVIHHAKLLTPLILWEEVAWLIVNAMVMYSAAEQWTMGSNLEKLEGEIFEDEVTERCEAPVWKPSSTHFYIRNL